MSTQRKYAPPSKRAAITSLDMSDKNFPPLNSTVMMRTVDTQKETLSHKIKETIRIADEERNKEKQNDIHTMTDTELIKDGWAILNLRNAKAIDVDPLICSYVKEADSGMSFEEYLHYKGVKI